VAGPGEGGDRRNRASEGHRVEVPLRALLTIPGGESGVDFGRQVRAEVRGIDRQTPRRPLILNPCPLTTPIPAPCPDASTRDVAAREHVGRHLITQAKAWVLAGG